MTVPMSRTTLSTMPTDGTKLSEIQNYRDMAASCRKIAATSRRPGPLVLRAQVYDAAALDLERTMAAKR
jgi:hypothetical protein